MKCTIILTEFQSFDEGTILIKNKDSKNNVFVIMLSNFSNTMKYGGFLKCYEILRILLEYLNIILINNNLGQIYTRCYKLNRK
jgi:hypothetical protein